MPRVSSSEASQRTQRRRRDDLIGHRETISGGKEEAQGQLGLEVRALPKQERQEILSKAGVRMEIEETQALAIKADLSIPWYRLRILRRLITSTYMYIQMYMQV